MLRHYLVLFGSDVLRVLVVDQEWIRPVGSCHWHCSHCSEFPAMPWQKKLFIGQLSRRSMRSTIGTALVTTTTLHPFNSLFSRWAWVSWYQKGKTRLDLNEAGDDGVLGYSGISWTICIQSAPRCRQITTPTTHHSIFTGRMLFLTPSQQCQSTEGIVNTDHTHTHTLPFNGPFSGTTQVSQYQKGKTNLDFTGARDSEWQWRLHLAPDRQPCQHPTAQFFTGRMPFLPPSQQCQSTEGNEYRSVQWKTNPVIVDF